MCVRVYVRVCVCESVSWYLADTLSCSCQYLCNSYVARGELFLSSQQQREGRQGGVAKWQRVRDLCQQHLHLLLRPRHSTHFSVRGESLSPAFLKPAKLLSSLGNEHDRTCSTPTASRVWGLIMSTLIADNAPFN